MRSQAVLHRRQATISVFHTVLDSEHYAAQCASKLKHHGRWMTAMGANNNIGEQFLAIASDVTRKSVPRDGTLAHLVKRV